MSYSEASLFLCTKHSTYELKPLTNRIRKVAGIYKREEVIGKQWVDILGVPAIELGQRLHIVVSEGYDSNGHRIATIVRTTPLREFFTIGQRGAA